MIKTANHRFYPNPFRYGKGKTINSKYEIFEEIRQKLKPLLVKFPDLQNHIDEFGEPRSELRIIRMIRTKIEQKVDVIYNKSKRFVKPLVKQFEDHNNFENYQKNLRYLELPIHANTDKKGFEIQALSHELIENAMEEVEDGYTLVYEYASNYFPDPIEMWNEHVILNMNDFPHILHDDILESTYEILDTFVVDLQKNSINLFNRVLSGDLNNRLLKIVESNTIYENDLRLSFRTLMVYIIIPILVFKTVRNIALQFEVFRKVIYRVEDNLWVRGVLFQLTVRDILDELIYQRTIFKQETTILIRKFSKTNWTTTFKYRILKLLVGKKF